MAATLAMAMNVTARVCHPFGVRAPSGRPGFLAGRPLLPSAPPMRRVLSASVATTLLCGGSSCALVLDPERLDDVPRCEYDVDCPEAPDPRFEMVCTTADESLAAPKICSPRAAVSCAPSQYAFDTEFRVRHREATEHVARYDNRCHELGGVQGCPPGPDGCLPGLAPDPESGRCDDSDPHTPAALAPEPIVRLQDVLDQFCRSMYCNDDFVCHTRTNRCVRCEPGQPLGRGGCGDLYIDGHRSTVYLSDTQMEDACLDEDMTVFDARLGPVSTVSDDAVSED
jgi:hypothetical protein